MTTESNEIEPRELKQRLDRGEAIQIIDIREEHEIITCGINGKHLPMAEVMGNRSMISADKLVVVHCRTGARGAAVVHMLRHKHGMTNVVNLRGGIMAWNDQVDGTLNCE
jgi:rhodanese-related sulfurtransferase